MTELVQSKQTKPLTDIEQDMIREAVQEYGEILPCGGKNTFNECFIDYKNGVKTFWFNDIEDSTHIIRRNLL